MSRSSYFAALLLVAPLAAFAQTKPATTPAPANSSTTITSPPVPGAPGQVTEVTEELDPVTGKVIRRTTRTTTTPAGSSTTGTSATYPIEGLATTATDAQVSSFLRKKTTVATLTAPALLDAYNRFIERVRADRHNWKATDWTAAAAILSSLNARYDQLRTNFSFDDKVTIRSQQAEFQTLRTARQLGDQVSDKL